MRSLSVIFIAMILSIFVISANAQDHASHHPDQSATMQTDSGSGMGMMHNMMSGGMMGEKSMHPMCAYMMQGGMMNMMHGQGMMGNHGLMHTNMHLVNHLPSMKAKLELTDEQMKQLKSIQSDFFKRKADWEAKIEKKEIDLDLLTDGKASASDVRKTLKSIYDTKLEMNVASYDAAQKMKAVLTSEQQQKFDEMGSMCMGQGMMEMMHGQM